VSAQLDGLRAFVATRPAAPTSAPAVARNVVVVGSGQGGSGTSVVAALVALAAAGAGRRVLLVDGDEHVGPQRYLLGIPAGPALADLRSGGDAESLVVPVSATLSLVPGGPGAAGGAPLEAAERRAMLRRLAGLYPTYDLVVVDGGSRLDTVCAWCEAAGAGGPARLLVVGGTDPIALASSYALVKAARERTAAVSGRPVATDLVVNGHDDADAELAFTHVSQACRTFLDSTMRLAGALPHDGCLDVGLRAGMPLQDAAAGSPAAVAAHAMVERLLHDLVGPHAATRPALPFRRAANPYASSLSTPAGALR
jgi:MinD-like ATPase involved in chromosome partitioning or flagellar assembly